MSTYVTAVHGGEGKESVDLDGGMLVAAVVSGAAVALEPSLFFFGNRS